MDKSIPSPIYNPFQDKVDKIRQILGLSPSDPLVIGFSNGNKIKLPQLHPTLPTPDVLVNEMNLNLINLSVFEIYFLSKVILDECKKINNDMLNDQKKSINN